jgi:hypothetical protein
MARQRLNRPSLKRHHHREAFRGVPAHSLLGRSSVRSSLTARHQDRSQMRELGANQLFDLDSTLFVPHEEVLIGRHHSRRA